MLPRVTADVRAFPKTLQEVPRKAIDCAVCGPNVGYRVRYAERVAPGPIDFRARKVPTHEHFRVVECTSCGLVYSNPIIPAEVIEDFYCRSPFITAPGFDANMVRDYRRHLEGILDLLPGRTRLLEIGCANGVFLEAALDLGFQDVRGVEPGEAAVAQARPDIRPRIVNSLFRPELFEPRSFDVICCFQILDHFLDPVALLRGVHALARDGGVVLLVNHNIRSWLPRLLGRRCPMYDIEHIYLWDPRTVARVLDKTGFDVLRANNVPTSYSLTHALRMFPFPWSVKKPMLALCEHTGVGNWRVRAHGGNMLTVGRKRGSASAPAPVTDTGRM